MGGSISGHQYTIEVPGSEQSGQTPIYLHPLAKPYLTTGLPSGALTLYQVLEHSVAKYSHLPFLGKREENGYLWKNYQDAFFYAKKIGWGLRKIGVSSMEMMGIFAKNREEWVLMDLACICQGVVTVPIYAMLTLKNIESIVDETRLKYLACSGNLIAGLVGLKREGRLQSVTHIISFDTISDLDLSESFLTVLDFAELANESEGEDHPGAASSVFTICYTSGTTGKGKGAQLTHGNIVATLAGIKESQFSFRPDDCHLSYLPLAHMMERVIIYFMAEAGGSIGFYGGDALKIRNDLALLKPTVFVSVPRLFNRFYDLIIQQFNSSVGINKILINKALDAKMNNYHNYKQVSSTVWDTLVFQNVRNALGGRIRFMLTGSAPITGEVLTFLRVVFSCPIVEGYGQTESCAGSFVTVPHDLECGHIGGPIPNLEAKIIDVPEMKYFSTDTDMMGNKAPRGELCLRGPTIFPGYLNPEENLEDTIDSQGWLHTGDIVTRLFENGAFKIIDRKKNFFKLAQGEYVAPERIESIYMHCKLISQIFVYGDSFQSFLIAVVVPNEKHVRAKWGKDKGLDGLSFEEICERDDLRKNILEEMDEKAEHEKLYGFEQVKRIYVEGKAWTTANLLTPTLKLIRHQAKMQYQAVIAVLYSQPEGVD